MVEVIIQLPDTLANTFGMTSDARAKRLTEDAAIEEYRAGLLSQRQVGEMLGLDHWQTEGLLTERHVPLNYSANDLQADQATLMKFWADCERGCFRHFAAALPHRMRLD